MEETKVLYHVNDEETPYLVKLPISSDTVSLSDLKNALSRPNYKYFFKSMDDDFGYNVCHYCIDVEKPELLLFALEIGS